MIVEHLIKLTFGINCDQKDHIQRICGMIFKSIDNFLHPLLRGFPIRKFHREPPRFPGASLFDKTDIHGISIRGKNHFHNALNKFSDCFHSCIVLFLNCLSSFCLHPRHALYPFYRTTSFSRRSARLRFAGRWMFSRFQRTRDHPLTRCLQSLSDTGSDRCDFVINTICRLFLWNGRQINSYKPAQQGF